VGALMIALLDLVCQWKNF